MKKLFFAFFVFSILLVSCSKNSAIDKKDACKAYDAASSYITNFGCVISSDDALMKSESANSELHFILDDRGDTCGTLVNISDVWRFALIRGNNLAEYEVSADEGNDFKVVTVPVYVPQKDILVTKEALTVAGALKSSSSGVCQYISEVGFNVGCWSLDENPFAYYYIVTTKIGDPITAYHYQWCADWYGNAVSCPLNETTYTMYYCGPPGL